MDVTIPYFSYAQTMMGGWCVFSFTHVIANHSKPLGRMGERAGTLPRWETVCNVVFIVVAHTGCLGMIDNMASDLNKWWQNISLHSWHLRREFMAITLMDRYIHVN
jgi:hypothetical protein